MKDIKKTATLPAKRKPRYFCPTSDVGFHKIFCTEGNDELVLQLLNAVIDDRTVISFRKLDPVHQINLETCATFDLYCRCDDGSRVIVECQNIAKPQNFMNRALAYSSLAILDQASARWDYDFDKVYFVGLLNFVQWRKRPQAFTKVALFTEDDHIPTNPNFLQIFVELRKLDADTGNGDGARLFLKALRDIGKTDERPEEFADESLDLLFRASDYNNLTRTERDEYDKFMTTKQDYLDYADFRWEEGKAEGLAEGEAKGMEMGKTAAQLEMAKKFKAAGIPVTTIAECSGLSIDEVERL